MRPRHLFPITLLLLALALSAFAQAVGTLRGQITDESGAVIPGAKVTVTGPAARTTASGNDGSYSLPGLPAGTYTVRAAAPGLTQFQPATVNISGSGVQNLNVLLRVALEKQQVTVEENAGPSLNTDPASNAGALVLRGADLDALSDDPDDLAADLQALAGPSAGPNGGQIFIDGFTGGQLPPKESIREIRINSNPFSAEYDRLGFGRIEIFTKPGSDKFHGQAFFNISDGIFNSRNPFLTGVAADAPFRSKHYGGNFSGPLSKKASFFLDFERRDIDDDGIISAQIVDPTSFLITPFSQFVPTPQHRTHISPRIDYQLSANNTLSTRYTYTSNDRIDAGVGNFNLASRGYNTNSRDQDFQATETSVIHSKIINETRFRYRHENNTQLGDNSLPAISVSSAFNGGGAQIGHATDTENHYELQNYTSFSSGAHSWKFGVRVRAIDIGNVSPSNFGGTYSFTNGTGPALDGNNQVILDANNNPVIQTLSSIERYRRTLLFQSQGLSPAAIRLLGGGASQFSLAAGNPLAAVNQIDLGLFVQDDWRVRPNLTLSLGLRYEWQTNIHDLRDLGPRIGFAWAPGQSKTTLRPKMVFRGGVGVFYDRFSEGYTLSAERFNGGTIQQYTAANPDFFPSIPSISQLQKGGVTSITTVDKNLRAPYIMQAAAGVERQLPRNTTVAVTYTFSRGVHLLRSRDINAPLPGTYNPLVPGSGVRPFGNVGEIDQFESTGVFNQHQLITNINSRMSRNVSIFGGYVLNFAKSNTDGAQNFPANQYDLASEYGRASNDIRNRLFLGGSLVTRWNFRLSPFIIANSGAPFNIVVGRDIYGDTLLGTARPAFAGPNASSVIQTAYGALDPNPQVGERLVPRNFGNGPTFFTVNLRLARTFGFGGERNA
ncbi:MAG: TonB-dependent receptor, partial [Acidobacteriota bacterium]|nr:TonB-dependent receptor [Acidobacteriota bacterium]